MALTLYNTLTRKKETFTPIEKGKVGMYCCGPTVYNYPHIGNMRSYIFSDILRRVLEYNCYAVTHVVNITDVGHLTDDADDGEDKMEKGARREGKTVWDVAQYYEDAFVEDMHALNNLNPHQYPHATKYIAEQIAFVQTLENKGFTYKTSDGIYFDTSKLKDYGKLAQLKIDKLEAGKRVDLGEKKNKTDFALWKFSPKEGPARAMEWESPWGKGFPGWHIECSVMSSALLGERFDIHTGGIDHIPIHHTNEIAQSEAAFGKQPVNYWMHNEFLVIDKGKMAKSEGNFLTLAVLEKDYSCPPLAYRYFCLTAHYRQQLQFSKESIDGAKASYERLKNIISELMMCADPGRIPKNYADKFLDAINDDLNMPKALAVLWDALRDKTLGDDEKLAVAIDCDKILGLDLLNDDVVDIPAEIIALAEKREKVRMSKDWPASDKLRDEIAEKGWQIADVKEGYKLKKQLKKS